MIPNLYNSKRSAAYSQMSDSGKNEYQQFKGKSQADADAIIALRNPTKPDSAVAHKPKTVTFGKIKTESSVGGKRKTSGYRYGANKPAKGSTTNQAK